jgi:hypothetical protein
MLPTIELEELFAKSRFRHQTYRPRAPHILDIMHRVPGKQEVLLTTFCDKRLRNRAFLLETKSGKQEMMSSSDISSKLVMVFIFSICVQKYIFD